MASYDEQALAAVVQGMGGGLGHHHHHQWKRDRDDHDVAGGFVRPAKMVRLDGAEPMEEASLAPVPSASTGSLRAAPYFYYKDYSTEVDPDPLKPLTAPGTVPNFVAKMHAILSRPDLADVIAWMPHGRSWRVLKPREFEIRVIPTYFEHAKFSSFIRQANGWGFRRITQGPDRNSYYHELFLRGLPHLCKKMKRPGVNQKQASDPEHEPDLYKISEMHPLPDKATDDSILLDCTVQGGPKARMPIYTGASLASAAASVVASSPSMAVEIAAPKTVPEQLTPMDLAALASFQKAMAASENQVQNVSHNPSNNNNHAQYNNAPVAMPQASFYQSQAPANAPLPTIGAASVAAADNSKLSALAAADRLAFFAAPDVAAFQASTAAASQFAAGFAAATALSHQQFRNLLGQAFAAASQGATNQPPNNNNNNMMNNSNTLQF